MGCVHTLTAVAEFPACGVGWFRVVEVSMWVYTYIGSAQCIPCMHEGVAWQAWLRDEHAVAASIEGHSMRPSAGAALDTGPVVAMAAPKLW